MAAPQQFDDEVGATEFQFPLLGLYADLELGRGSVNLPDDFKQAPVHVRLAILDDWLAALVLLRSSLQNEQGDAPKG